MKPDWKEAPAWAKYLTKDLDGEWFWHDTKPVFDGEYWRPGPDAQCRYAGASGNIEYLEERPDGLR